MSAAAAQPAEVWNYGGFVRRRWGWIAVGVLLGLVAGWFVQSHAAPSYTSRASVLVESSGLPSAELTNGRTRNAVNLDTEAQLVTSSEVATRAQGLLQTSAAPAALARQVNVTVPPNSQILVIAFESSTPVEAQQGAHAFAQAYLDNRSAQTTAGVEARAAALQEQVKELTADLKDAAGKAAVLPANSPDRAYADAQRSIIASQLANLNARMEDLRGVDPQAARIVSDANLPQAASGPSTWLYLVSGGMLGLLQGLALALIRERTDDRVRSTAMVEDLGVPVLGLLPRPFGPWGSSSRERNLYEQLRNVVLVAMSGRRSLLLTGPAQGLPIEQLGERFARSLAEAGRRVLLVDADPGRTSSSPGLSDVLAGLPPSRAVQQGKGLRLLPAGTDPATLRQLLASPVGADVFRDLRAEADMVVVLGPPSTDALTHNVAMMTERVLLVAEVAKTSRSSLVDALTQTRMVGAVTLGVVLVGKRSLLAHLTGRQVRRSRRGVPAEAVTGRSQQPASRDGDATAAVADHPVHPMSVGTPDGRPLSAGRRAAP